jgi:hypothetical protein
MTFLKTILFSFNNKDSDTGEAEIPVLILDSWFLTLLP